MTKFNTVNEMIEAYTNHHNAACDHSDKHFTQAEVAQYMVDAMSRDALARKCNIVITAKMATTIRGYGYVEA